MTLPALAFTVNANSSRNRAFAVEFQPDRPSSLYVFYRAYSRGNGRRPRGTRRVCLATRKACRNFVRNFRWYSWIGRRDRYKFPLFVKRKADEWNVGGREQPRPLKPLAIWRDRVALIKFPSISRVSRAAKSEFSFSAAAGKKRRPERLGRRRKSKDTRWKRGTKNIHASKMCVRDDAAMCVLVTYLCTYVVSVSTYNNSTTSIKCNGMEIRD